MYCIHCVDIFRTHSKSSHDHNLGSNQRSILSYQHSLNSRILTGHFEHYKPAADDVDVVVVVVVVDIYMLALNRCGGYRACVYEIYITGSRLWCCIEEGWACTGCLKLPIYQAHRPDPTRCNSLKGPSLTISPQQPGVCY